MLVVHGGERVDVDLLKKYHDWTPHGVQNSFGEDHPTSVSSSKMPPPTDRRNPTHRTKGWLTHQAQRCVDWFEDRGEVGSPVVSQVCPPIQCSTRTNRVQTACCWVAIDHHSHAGDRWGQCVWRWTWKLVVGEGHVLVPCRLGLIPNALVDHPH